MLDASKNYKAFSKQVGRGTRTGSARLARQYSSGREVHCPAFLNHVYPPSLLLSKQVATALKAVKPNDFQFLVNPTSGDLTGVKFEGESSQTELHTLSAESDFSEYSLQTATGLEPTTRATWRFLWNADGDLVGVKVCVCVRHALALSPSRLP